MKKTDSNLRFMAEYAELSERQMKALLGESFGIRREDNLIGRICDF
jgi:hypothetical protein